MTKSIALAFAPLLLVTPVHVAAAGPKDAPAVPTPKDDVASKPSKADAANVQLDAAAKQPPAPKLPKLSRKSGLAAAAGKSSSDLETPVVLSIRRPMIGSATYRVFNPTWTESATSDLTLYNRPDLPELPVRPMFVVIDFDAVAGRTYVIECVGTRHDWEIRESKLEGAGMVPVSESVVRGSARPTAILPAEDTTHMRVVFTPTVELGEYGTIGRCQITSMLASK